MPFVQNLTPTNQDNTPSASNKMKKDLTISCSYNEKRQQAEQDRCDESDLQYLQAESPTSSQDQNSHIEVFSQKPTNYSTYPKS